MQTLARCGVILAAAVLFGACGPPPHDRSEDIKPEAPSGTFAGNPWTMTHATVSMSDSKLSVRLFSEPVADCAQFPPEGSTAGYLLWTMPAELGKRSLRLSLTDFSSPNNQTITFVTPPSSNNISVDGIINVTELTNTSVTFGFLAKAGEGYDVNGTITTKICP